MYRKLGKTLFERPNDCIHRLARLLAQVRCNDGLGDILPRVVAMNTNADSGKHGALWRFNGRAPEAQLKRRKYEAVTMLWMFAIEPRMLFNEGNQLGRFNGEYKIGRAHV